MTETRINFSSMRYNENHSPLNLIKVLKVALYSNLNFHQFVVFYSDAHGNNIKSPVAVRVRVLKYENVMKIKVCIEHPSNSMEIDIMYSSIENDFYKKHPWNLVNLPVASKSVLQVWLPR